MASGAGYISIREYARRRGCSDAAVHKARRAGHLKDDAFAWNDDRTKRIGIYPDIADMQWAQSIDPAATRNAGLVEKILSRAKASGAKGAKIDKEPEVPNFAGATNGGRGPSKADAQRYEAVWRAKERELKYRQMAGELVDKNAVYKQLFSLGQQMRTRLQSIPDRLIDDVLAAPTRNEAHQLLFDAIADSLEELSKINETELG